MLLVWLTLMSVSSTDTRHSADERCQKGKHDVGNINKCYTCKSGHIYYSVKRVILSTKQQHGAC